MKVRSLFFTWLLLSSITIAKQGGIRVKELEMMQVGLEEKARGGVAEDLNRLLANEYVLYTKLLKFHWTVVGPFFGPLHTLFQQQYEQVSEFNDRIAERVRALGAMPLGTLAEFAQHASLQEEPGAHPVANDMIAQLVRDHEEIIRQLRALAKSSGKHDDAATENLVGEIIEAHEKMAWMLRSHIG